MSNKHQCRDCKLLLATQYDFDTIPSGEGQHLCWRQFTGDVCTGNPIEWQMRCYQAEAEITALRKEVERLGELIAGYKDTLLSVQKQHRRTQARTDAAEAALVEVREVLEKTRSVMTHIRSHCRKWIDDVGCTSRKPVMPRDSLCTHGNNECSSRPCSELLIHDTLSVSLGLLPIGEGYFLDENGINRAEPEKGENK